MAMYYQERCNRKCSVLDSCPVDVGHKAEPRKLSCFLPSLFFLKSQISTLLRPSAINFELYQWQFCVQVKSMKVNFLEY